MQAESKSVDVGRLKTLAEKANREHSQAQMAARQAVKHAVAAAPQPASAARTLRGNAQEELASLQCDHAELPGATGSPRDNTDLNGRRD